MTKFALKLNILLIAGLCIPLGSGQVSRTPVVTALGTTGDENVRSLSLPAVTLKAGETLLVSYNDEATTPMSHGMASPRICSMILIFLILNLLPLFQQQLFEAPVPQRQASPRDTCNNHRRDDVERYHLRPNVGGDRASPISREQNRAKNRGARIRYSSVDAGNAMPMPTIVDSGYPTCMVNCTTNSNLSNFIGASQISNAPERPVSIRPAQRRFLPADIVVFRGCIAIACRWS